MDVWDPSTIDPRLDSRAVTFENLSGGRGSGGTAGGGRKGAPNRVIAPGETVVLADLRGPGTLRHLWFTVPPALPERLRALTLEVFYDGASEPSVSVPILDFVGLPHGRRAPIYSALLSVNEGRGYNTYFPMPFEHSVRVEFANRGTVPTTLYYQIDYTLEPDRQAPPSYLHASFRRANPTTRVDDFVIVDGLQGPGRFLGCAVGVRVLDEGPWYGEGEVKIFRDGDTTYPTICGTGLEDYVGSAWGLGHHIGPYAGTPLDQRAPGPNGGLTPVPDFVGFYRFHLLDPVMFADDLRVTIQQIGISATTGRLAERVDDYCATAWVYCRTPQGVPRVDVAAAIADIGRLPYEPADPLESLLQPGNEASFT